MLDVIESLFVKIYKNTDNKVDGCTVLLNLRLLDYILFFMEMMSQWILSALLGLNVLRVIHH